MCIHSHRRMRPSFVLLLSTALCCRTHGFIRGAHSLSPILRNTRRLSGESSSDGIFHEVTLQLFGEEIVINAPENVSILEIAEAAGLRSPWECRRGNCITCAGKFAEGSTSNLKTYVTYKDAKDESFLCKEAIEAGFFLSCCSYVAGPGLKLDLGMTSEASVAQYSTRYSGTETSEQNQPTATVIRGHLGEPPDEFIASLEKVFKDS